MKQKCCHFDEIFINGCTEKCRNDNFRWSLWLKSWWRHQMETFSALLILCEGNSPITGEFPSQRPMTRSFDIFSLICTKTKWLSKPSRPSWFETPSLSLWRHCNVHQNNDILVSVDLPIIHKTLRQLDAGQKLYPLRNPMEIPQSWTYTIS